MSTLISYGALISGLIAIFNIMEIIFYFFLGIKNKTILKWTSVLAASVLLLYFPNMEGILFLLFGLVAYTMGKMILLVESVKTSNS
ncbi:MAG: hypothetical protein IPP60_06940 [Sphingobacteriales bacterium]|nr:hypothetical protein [Sphingobacteriales bacterium]